MSTDVNAYVEIVGNINVFEIAQNISESLKKFCYVTPKARLYPDIQTVIFEFGVINTAGVRNIVDYTNAPIIEKRALYAFFRDNKVTVNLTIWGMAEKIITHVGQGLMQFGTVYYTPNDCDIKPYELKEDTV